MRAALLRACGTAPVVGDRPVPVPAEDEILVRVTAASITPLDRLCASGTSYFGVPATPYVPGVQGVGLRDDGTAVWFPTGAGMRPGDGSLAEYAAVRAADTVALPDDVDHRLIAALGLSAVAAHLALTWRGELRPGEHVLVLGAGGVVGQSAIRLALLAGAGRVVAAARSGAARQRAARAGAAVVVPLHDGDDVARLTARLRAAADGPVDLVLDPLFGIPAAAALRTLRPGGRLVNLGSAAGETAPLDSATLRAGSLRVLGYTNNELTPAQRAAALTLVAEHAAAGRLAVDHETVRLSDVTTAWRRTDSRMVVIP
ncbi:zinc-binding dehydrogenase [Amorphoplanes nipponensis]|uniref:NADPH:quinone reductase n=1 Tax=Actinoplanes nipponensis TaxID=135950 RepID=A0A919MSN5_9ACTN|nr:zinc-binding alcohol dehydrogenase family protein [Actinoplanes nipponensis]GIE52758.1 NADPH:quinone reductase [Actinoplanes nipponensis]